jgi:hypothetical protein
MPEGAPSWRPGIPTPPDPLAGLANDPNADGPFQQAANQITTAAAAGAPPVLGPRKNEYLPFLVVRAFPGDRGSRPIAGVTWESPDIFVAPNLDASAAPPLPTTLGGVAAAGAPNTLWAHIWNVGRAPVVNARVEFYWYEPTIAPDATSAHLIGAAHVDLGDRFSGRAHTIVKCPNTWVAEYRNGGHECLIVRCFEPMLDALGPNQWSSAEDRHVGQRNISVIDTHSPAILQLPLRLGCATGPGPARIEVTPLSSKGLSWLSLYSLNGEPLRDAESVQEIVGLMYPTPVRDPANRLPQLDFDARSASGILRSRIDFVRGCDELETVLFIKAEGLKHAECRVYRVKQTVDGRLVSGYTVLVRGR